MKRALVVYLEDKPNLMMQFGWLYTSLKYIQSTDTDIVVFGTSKALKKVPKDCIKIKYKPISYRKQWQKYHYINSISCLADDRSAFLDEYDFLLRTDVDTFLTPAWNDYYPDFYTVGGGGYVHNQDVKRRLKRISHSLGYKHRGIHNVGSTHYGYAPLVRKVCNLAVSTAKYIINNEFSNGHGIWPGWFWGVTSMYSSEIAVNHLVNKVIIDGEKLDYFSTSSDLVMKHPHIHCWHTFDKFSKFDFEAGKYDHISMEELDTTKVNDYCLFIALKAKKELPWLQPSNN
ncbi:hypothetical protein ACFSO7_04450 [Bacillus sp. CGMCC 1.16607]|uniref:DUF7164 domain-containing protein n=1 Tax=Bacillus sp. CGMCC 1.16607 TaxID=3351842 RepID=UPI003631489D